MCLFCFYDIIRTVFDLQCLSFTCMYLHVEVIFHPIVLSELFNYLRLLSYKCSILDFSMLIRQTISFTYLHLLSSSCRYRLYTFRVKMHVLTCTCIYLHVKVDLFVTINRKLNQISDRVLKMPMQASSSLSMAVFSRFATLGLDDLLRHYIY